VSEIADSLIISFESPLPFLRGEGRVRGFHDVDVDVDVNSKVNTRTPHPVARRLATDLSP